MQFVDSTLAFSETRFFFLISISIEGEAKKDVLMAAVRPYFFAPCTHFSCSIRSDACLCWFDPLVCIPARPYFVVSTDTKLTSFPLTTLHTDYNMAELDDEHIYGLAVGLGSAGAFIVLMVISMIIQCKHHI